MNSPYCKKLMSWAVLCLALGSAAGLCLSLVEPLGLWAWVPMLLIVDLALARSGAWVALRFSLLLREPNWAIATGLAGCVFLSSGVALARGFPPLAGPGWPLASAVTLTGACYMVDLLSSRMRPKPFHEQVARLLLVQTVVAVGALSVAVGHSLQPGSQPALYYFSSLLQGFAALLGLTVSAALVSLQLATSNYGLLLSPRRILSQPALWLCLSGHLAVILLSASALGLPGLPQIWCTILATTTFFVGAVTLGLTVLAVKVLVQGLDPETVMGTFVVEVAQSESPDQGALASVLSRLSGDSWHEWLAGVSAYMKAARRTIWRTPSASRADTAVRLAGAILAVGLTEQRSRHTVVGGLLNIVDDLLGPDPYTAWAVFSRVHDLYHAATEKLWAARFSADLMDTLGGQSRGGIDAKRNLVNRARFTHSLGGATLLTQVFARVSVPEKWAQLRVLGEQAVSLDQLDAILGRALSL